MLGQLGYEPLVFNNSREALEADARRPRDFDAVVTTR
jgi:hypothetical protein